jgi:hypothetical protein
MPNTFTFLRALLHWCFVTAAVWTTFVDYFQVSNTSLAWDFISCLQSARADSIIDSTSKLHPVSKTLVGSGVVLFSASPDTCWCIGGRCTIITASVDIL